MGRGILDRRLLRRGGYGHAVLPQDRGHRAEGAGLVSQHEAQVECRSYVAGRAKFRLAFRIARHGAHVARLAVGKVARDVADVAHHGGSRGRASRAASVIHGIVAHVALDHRGVEHAVDAREHVAERHERGMHANLHFVAVPGYDRQQLDAVSEVRRVLDVHSIEVANTFDLNLI